MLVKKKSLSSCYTLDDWMSYSKNCHRLPSSFQLICHYFQATRIYEDPSSLGHSMSVRSPPGPNKPSYSPSSMPSTNKIIYQLHTRSCQRSRFRAIWSSIHGYRSRCHRAQDLILFHAFEATWQLGSSFHEKTQTRQADTSSSASGCVHSTLDGSLVVT